MNHLIDTDPESCASTLSFESLRMVSEVEPLSTLSSTPHFVLRLSVEGRSLRLEESLSKGRREDSKHLKFLQILIDKIIKRLEDNSYEPKIRDALRAIQLKQKLSEAKSVGVAKTSEVERSETHRAEKIFWQEIEAIRRDVLSKLYPHPINLEDQIQRTIIGLKHLVKNGILPVKTITDLKTQNSGTFNQGKSKESQLTYHRIGRLLSTMGFRKARTPNGCSAIIWDDKLLQDESFLKIHFLTHRIRARMMAEKNLKQSPVRSVRSEIPASQLKHLRSPAKGGIRMNPFTANPFNPFNPLTTFQAPQHFLYFLPLPQGQGSFRPIFLPTLTGLGLPGATCSAG